MSIITDCNRNTLPQRDPSHVLTSPPRIALRYTTADLDLNEASLMTVVTTDWSHDPNRPVLLEERPYTPRGQSKVSTFPAATA